MKAAHALQDAITVKQANKGKFEDPGWKKEEVEAMREKINVVAAALPPLGLVLAARKSSTRSTGCSALPMAGMGCRGRTPPIPAAFWKRMMAKPPTS